MHEIAFGGDRHSGEGLVRKIGEARVEHGDDDAFAVQAARAGDYTTAEGFIFRMQNLAVQINAGRDLNSDGQIGWGDGEGGVSHVTQHVGFIVQGEGLE